MSMIRVSHEFLARFVVLSNVMILWLDLMKKLTVIRLFHEILSEMTFLWDQASSRSGVVGLTEKYWDKALPAFVRGN